ncbi:hypothetical protein NDU88_002624 [Pleurodeles waltl]|uniref:Uncharacterized protein n=1 Tax=Pleurodeles waltl TaxID=8319 RepID=A0AAV7WLS1_PLEWA|nr:hypothetical protein NDU88_002624 [Pleurodeles waltl]
MRLDYSPILHINTCYRDRIKSTEHNVINSELQLNYCNRAPMQRVTTCEENTVERSLVVLPAVLRVHEEVTSKSPGSQEHQVSERKNAEDSDANTEKRGVMIGHPEGAVRRHQQVRKPENLKTKHTAENTGAGTGNE